MNSLVRSVIVCACCTLPEYVVAQTINATYDDQDRLLTYGSKHYTYDDNGDLTSVKDGSITTKYDYDVRGSLLSVTRPDITITYQIDPKGRRVGKKINGNFSKAWLYHNRSQIAAELDSFNNVVSHFVYASKHNTPDYFIKGGINYKIISDHIGSVRLVVNASTGATLQRIDYDPFGVVIADSNPGFQPFGFAGGLYDPDTQLVRFGARDYDPSVGRWTVKDPLNFKGGDTNLYGYVFNNPINWDDSSGLEVWKCKRPADIYILGMFVDHNWIMTSSLEVGMGAEGEGVPGSTSSLPDLPYITKTTNNDHTGQALRPGSDCQLVPNVDEDCVNSHLALGKKLGRWTPTNQCQSFVRDTLAECTTVGDWGL